MSMPKVTLKNDFTKKKCLNHDQLIRTLDEHKNFFPNSMEK